MSASIVVHVGRNARDNRPRRTTTDAGGLFKALCVPRGATKDGEYFQAVDYANGAHRDLDSVTRIYAYVVDLDSGDWSADDIRTTMGGIRCLAYTTSSSGPLASDEEAVACESAGLARDAAEKEKARAQAEAESKTPEEIELAVMGASGGPRCTAEEGRCKAHNGRNWRVVVPFAKPVTKEVFSAIHRAWAVKTFGSDLGAESGKPAQLWYMARSGAEVFTVDGELFDPNPYLEVAEAPQGPPAGANGEDRPNGPVFKALDAAGLVLRRGPRDKPGSWLIRCPWSDEHTSGEDGDSSTMYWEAHHGGKEGEGFACKHSHCDGRLIGDVREKLGVKRPWKLGDGADRSDAEVDPESPVDWADAFVLTEDEVNEIADPEWLYRDLIISAHIIALVGPPGAGKTTVMLCHVAAELVRRGLEVYYVNADTSAGDAKFYAGVARRSGVTLMTPDIKGGGMEKVIAHLAAMAEAEGADYSGKVFVFDTLKKMTEVINKRLAAQLYKLLRALTAKGMTIVLLGHTNKHLGDDGKYVFEGTADLRSDSDDLIYLLPKKNPDGSLVVSTDPEAPTAKTRGNHQPITFEIAEDRTVRAVDYVDVGAALYAERQHEKDREHVDTIAGIIAGGAVTQNDIVEKCRGVVGKNTALRILETYGRQGHPFQRWRRERGMQHRSWRHYLLDRGGKGGGKGGGAENRKRGQSD